MAKLPCPPELWPEFSELLDQALELADNERPAWLSALGPEHDAVRPWLKRVIAGDGATLDPQFLQSPPLDISAPEFTEGQHIGPYLLQTKLGSGGMGEVWLSSRGDGTLKRQVALKLPHSHIMAGVQRRRFERERDILATLSHPNIAQLYDAGVADSKHPYLAMEWVDGADINDHCREAKLSLNGRLNLFLQVLDAVGYAHGRFIAHRDLKPSNILVTREERVKLLDFGIAKLLGGDTEIGATQLTRVGVAMATPGYAAPEQLRGDPITAAVDIYALGVVLHELLTGTRPHRELRKNNDLSDLPRASSRIDTGHAQTVGGVEHKALRREITGDLDAIIAKALETDPAQRYTSAEAFAQDIRNSLRHRPISARRLSAARLTLMFVRRHWVGVAMSATLLLVIVGGSAGIAWQAVRAEKEAQRATTIKDFLIGVFRASDPRIAADKPRGEITARELLDASTNQIESGFAQQPETQIELLGVTADIYHELDETKRSTALYKREAELASRYHGKADGHAIEGLLGQAYNADADGDDARALDLLMLVDPLLHQSHLDNTPLRASWYMMRGEALIGAPTKGDEARGSLETAAALFKAVAPQDLRYPELLTDLGNIYLTQSQFGQSANYYRQAIALAERNVQMEGDLLLADTGLALALKLQGDFGGAAAAFEHGSKIAARTYGQDSFKYWSIASDWAKFRYERGEREPALAAFETLLQNLPSDRSAFSSSYAAMQAARVLLQYGHCLTYDGQGHRSIEILQRAQLLLTKSTPDALNEANLELDLGKAYQESGRVADARNSYIAAVDTLKTQRAPASQLAVAHERLGQFFLSQNDTARAYSEFSEVLRLSDGHRWAPAILAQAGLAAIAVARHDASAAAEDSRVAIDQLDHIEGNFDVRIQPQVWGIRARSLMLSGDREQARSLAVRTRDAATLYYSPASREVAEATALVLEASTSEITRGR
jgi:serine/threonine protein kinase/tetratricopeptide (TPR) repeat protein